MAYHVGAGKLGKGDSPYVVQHADRIDQAALLAPGQIDLSHVASDHGPDAGSASLLRQSIDADGITRTPALEQRGRAALARIAAREKAGVAVGAQTRGEIERLHAVLDAVQAANKAPAKGPAAR